MEDELETIASGENNYVKVLDDFYKHSVILWSIWMTKRERSKKSLQHRCRRSVWSLRQAGWSSNGVDTVSSKRVPDILHAKTASRWKMKRKNMPTLPGLICKTVRWRNESERRPIRDVPRLFELSDVQKHPADQHRRKMPEMCPTERSFRAKHERKEFSTGVQTVPVILKTCDFISWEMPVMQPCKHCGNNYLTKKSTKRKGDYLLCPNCKEEYYFDRAGAKAIAV